MLKHISVPVLVIEGAKTNVPLNATKEYVRIIKNAKLVLVPNAGHQNWLDQPEAVLNALDKFFKSTFD
jgi:pimeloyl-ACP methyl ester carboxylesterase